jgi:hypothetical protein
VKLLKNGRKGSVLQDALLGASTVGWSNNSERMRQELFEVFSKRGRGRPAGSRNPTRDAELYEEYRVRLMTVNSDAEREALPRVLANELHQTRRGYFGNSAAAIEKKLRRILEDQRDPRARLAAAKDQLEAARRRPLAEPWRGTKRKAVGTNTK